MSRVTSKLQVTIPKAIADRYGIEPGTDIDWLPAGDGIRVVPPANATRERDLARRLELFDRATERNKARAVARTDHGVPADRGWRREDLYGRGVAD
jgi:AbrB family looped-hinge helix DNA binding protein